MSILRWLFAQGSQTTPQDHNPVCLKEKANRGTRQDTLSQASAYWMSRISSPKKDPFVLYTFDTEAAARQALLALPCIHVAADTGKLLCTETLIFGCYPTDRGDYEAIVCGDDLTHELWEQAKASFARHGGRPKGPGELEPEKRVAAPQKQVVLGKVSFVREDRQQEHGAIMVYKVHKGPNAASAKAFLEAHPVTQKLHYFVVETPEGNYCRDIEGIYKE
jgi:hypothetical protein